MPNMILKAATYTEGSECEVDMDISQEEWNQLDEREQQDLINEYMSNVVEIWVEPETYS